MKEETIPQPTGQPINTETVPLLQKVEEAQKEAPLFTLDSRVLDQFKQRTQIDNVGVLISNAMQIYADCLNYEEAGYVLAFIPVKVVDEKLVPETDNPDKKTMLYPLSQMFTKLIPKEAETPIVKAREDVIESAVMES